MIDIDSAIAQLPAPPGSYVLPLHLSRPRTITAGRLGEVRLPAGEYFYAGSALGPGGLRARVGRHLRGDGRPHWHIDRLRTITEIRGVYYALSDESQECLWSQALAALPHARIPVPGFGSSDCQSICRSHLIAFPSGTNLRDILSACCVTI